MLLGGDLDGRWSAQPTSLISWLDGEADITPSDPERWARELGRGAKAVWQGRLQHGGGGFGPPTGGFPRPSA